VGVALDTIANNPVDPFAKGNLPGLHFPVQGLTGVSCLISSLLICSSSSWELTKPCSDCWE